ncbi:hypothetical protein [Porcipelethomonas sp.]|uniref:hypothetical protein n=1 Tax=Porcipelethomonas sp. TaxID=2981675 RepID=UPI003EF335AD
MKRKFFALVSAAVFMTSLFTACENDNTKEAASESQTASDSAAVTAASGAITKINGKTTLTLPAAKNFISTNVKTYRHSNKAFTLKGYSTALFMENGWEIVSGGEATDMQSDDITSFPAVIKYKDTKDTLTITIVDEYEDKESFLAGTEESYIEAYGSVYESIDITDFQQLTIDEFDSFKIVADVVISGEKFEMTHILSNDVSGKSYSWMMLDADGELKDFDLVEAICYPKIAEKITRGRRFN